MGCSVRCIRPCNTVGPFIQPPCKPRAVKRRNCLLVAKSLGLAALAGCLETDSEPSSESVTASTSGSTDGDEGTSRSEPTDSAPTDTVAGTPAATIGAYFQAVSTEDTDALRDTLHSESPFVDTVEAGEVVFPETNTADDFDPDTAETVGTDPTVEAVLEFEAASFVFDEASLESVLTTNSGVLVEAAAEPTNLAQGKTWIVLPESGEWRVFWVGRRPDIPDTPSDVFDEPIEDTDNDVVESVDWDYDQETDGAVANVAWVRVNLTDAPGLDAETVRVESTIEGWETELSGGEDELNGWAGSWANVALHEDGDQLVVTAISGDTETVVHRVHYEPES